MISGATCVTVIWSPLLVACAVAVKPLVLMVVQEPETLFAAMMVN